MAHGVMKTDAFDYFINKDDNDAVTVDISILANHIVQYLFN